MTDDEHLQLALDTAAELEKKHKATGMQATPFMDNLRNVLTWLRQQNIPWAKIFAAMPQIIAALSAGNWAAVFTTLITLFGLPAGTPHPAFGS